MKLSANIFEYANTCGLVVVVEMSFLCLHGMMCRAPSVPLGVPSLVDLGHGGPISLISHTIHLVYTATRLSSPCFPVALASVFFVLTHVSKPTLLITTIKACCMLTCLSGFPFLSWPRSWAVTNGSSKICSPTVLTSEISYCFVSF